MIFGRRIIFFGVYGDSEVAGLMITDQREKDHVECTACECDTFEFMKKLGMKVLHPGGLAATGALAEQCGISKNMMVLDAGCGRGSTSIFLARRYGCRVVGVDMDQRLLLEAQKTAWKNDVSDKVSLRVADIHSLPFEDDTFDVAIVQATLVFTEKLRVLQELFRKIRPGGYVGVLELAWKSPPTSSVAARAAKVICNVVVNAEEHEGWANLLCRSGLTIINAELRDVGFNLGGMLQNEGFLSTLKIALKSTFEERTRNKTKEIASLFREIKDYLGYGIYVGKKAC